MQYRTQLRDLIGGIVRDGMTKKRATGHIAEWAGKNVQQSDRDKFNETAEGKLLGLHEGNFARYQRRFGCSWMRGDGTI